MEKILITLACIFTLICWISLCFDWYFSMYTSGIIALCLIGIGDYKKKLSADDDKLEEK
ncbi:MAG: hypothetical protein J1D77_03520 [Muribaculaceae bacterium]|nr:hypothetical protein [Muribaculaceae bacterium]